MSENLVPKVFTFQGGFATDLAPESRELTFLTKAENCMYEVSGAVRKVGGATRINGTTVTNSPNIIGMHHAFYTTASGSFTNRFIVVDALGKINTMADAGALTDITGSTSMSTDTVPVFAMLNDVLTLWTSDNDTPLQITVSGNAATLTGSPPAGRGAVRYANRLWSWGDNSNPSALTFCAVGDPQTWTGGDTGSLTIDNDDGDRIVGAIPYKGSLLIFKGPNFGSLHILTGRAISDFAVDHLISGVALQSPNLAVAVGNDVWFMGENGVYSVAATEKFGNFEQADLTRFLKGFFRDTVTRSRMNNSWAVHYSEKSMVLFTLSSPTGSEEDMALGLSYIKQQEEGIKPLLWKDRDALSAAIRINPTTGLKDVVFGSTDGYVLREDDTTDLSLPSNTAYIMTVETPRITLLPGDIPAQLYDMYVKLSPVGNYNLSVSVFRDGAVQLDRTFNQGTTGFVLNTDALGTGLLGGQIVRTVRASEGGLEGEARAVGFRIVQGGDNQDALVFELGLLLKPTAPLRDPTITS